MGIVAGIITKNDFVMPNSKSKTGKKINYKGYVDYTSRKEAMKEEAVFQKMNEGNYIDSYEEFDQYVNGYMNNKLKTKGSGLFNEGLDELLPEQYKDLKKQFEKAQKNGSPLWQDVVSFDNQWLEKHGVYDSKTKVLKEDVLRNAIRSGVTSMLKEEKLNNSTVWYAAIHYNTDNIHVHIASVEPVPSQSRWMESKQAYRGYRKPKSTSALKSKVANYILDRGKEQSKINDLIRNQIVKEKKNTPLNTYKKTKDLFLQAMKKLPEDKKQWFYNYHTIDEARPFIDEISNIYLDTFHKKEMMELNYRLDLEVEVMKETYGEGSQHEKYKEKKLNELYTRMGNAVLQEMRSYDSYLKNDYIRDDTNRKNKTLQPKQMMMQKSWKRQGELDRSIMSLHYHLRKGFHEYQKDKNIAEFDRMLEGRD